MAVLQKLVSELKPNLPKPEPAKGFGACWLYSSWNDSHPSCRSESSEDACAYTAQTSGAYSYSWQPGDSCSSPGHP